jgi:hypothetical protein
LLNFSKEITSLIFFADKKIKKIKGKKTIESFVSNIFNPSEILVEVIKLKPYSTNTRLDKIKSFLFMTRFFELINIIKDTTPRLITNNGLIEGGIKIVAEKQYKKSASNLSIIFFILFNAPFINRIICHE